MSSGLAQQRQTARHGVTNEFCRDDAPLLSQTLQRGNLRRWEPDGISHQPFTLATRPQRCEPVQQVRSIRQRMRYERAKLIARLRDDIARVTGSLYSVSAVSDGGKGDSDVFESV